MARVLANCIMALLLCVFEACESWVAHSRIANRVAIANSVSKAYPTDLMSPMEFRTRSRHTPLSASLNQLRSLPQNGVGFPQERDELHLCKGDRAELRIDESLDLTRRYSILSVLCAAVVFCCPADTLANDLDANSVLRPRFGAVKVRRFDPAGPLGAPEATLPAWLAGEWDATYTYQGASFPLGKSFAEFKQLLGGNLRSPSESTGSETSVTFRWVNSNEGVVEDKAFNLQNYYNAFSKPITVESSKGPRTRIVGWMPILTQRGVYEKVNSVTWKGRNDFEMIVKEIAPDLSVVGATPMEGTVVSRKWEAGPAGDTFTISELFRIRRLSQGRVKMVETGTGDTEVLTEYRREGDGSVVGRHRVLVYLVPFPGPAGDLYADSEGNAVAVYDWQLRMTPRK